MLVTSELLASLAPDAVAEAVFTPLRFLGRLHPLLVHFPIGLVMAAAALEVWRWVRREAGLSPATPSLLLGAAVFGIVAAVAGWMNAGWEHAGDASDDLFWHRWLGVTAALFMVVAAALARRAVNASPLSSWVVAQRLAVLASAGLVAIGGHLGGELVYGEGYVFKGLFSHRGTRGLAAAPGDGGTPKVAPPPANPSEAFFVTSVEPILRQHCSECHGARKQKGRLRLDPIGAAFTGPEEDWVIVPGDARASDLLARVLLERDDPDAMPPEGDGLTPDEVAILRRWIIEGAAYPASRSFEGEPVDDDDASSGRAEPSLTDDRGFAAIAARGGVAQRTAQREDAIDVNVSLAQPAWKNSDLVLLAPIAPEIERLHLGRAALTDEGILALPPMPALRRLRLDHVPVTDRIVDVFLAMPQLEVLNLVGTKVGDGGLIRLAESKTLRTLYVWQSNVSEAGIAALRERRPDLEVVDGRVPAPEAVGEKP